MPFRPYKEIFFMFMFLFCFTTNTLQSITFEYVTENFYSKHVSKIIFKQDNMETPGFLFELIRPLQANYSYSPLHFSHVNSSDLENLLLILISFISF